MLIEINEQDPAEGLAVARAVLETLDRAGCSLPRLLHGLDATGVGAVELGERLDLGSLWVPGITGMELRLELDQQTGEVVAVSCHLGGSALQLQAFAAPRTLGIWDNIRDEIAAGIEGQGGAAETRDGRFGTELAVQMPS